MQASMSVLPASCQVSSKRGGMPFTSRKWTKLIFLPNFRISRGRSSVIRVKLPWHMVMVLCSDGSMSIRRW
ncbi:hypothetical protein D3C87_2082040 [compost metagenome]